MLQHNVLGLYAWRALNTLKSRLLSAEDARITGNLLAQTDNRGQNCSCCPHQWCGSKTSVATCRAKTQWRNNVVLSDPEGKIMIGAVAPRVQTQLVWIRNGVWS